MFKKIKIIHFVGIGGSGMSGIAEVLLNLGYKVTGSDLKENEIIHRLKRLGAQIHIGHHSRNIGSAQVVVISTAVSPDNPEVVTAQKLKIPVIPRIEMLAELARLKYTISIAGTHGKTTTTSLIGMLLADAGMDPTLVVGGRIRGLDTGAKLGRGEYLVAEADESDGSFLKLNPTIAIVTNIDNDHLDYYRSMYKLKSAFIEFINRIPFYGWAILCLDDVNVREIIPQIKRKFYTYGIDYPADFRAAGIRTTNQITSYGAWYRDKFLGEISLHLPGKHNILNSLAAVACASTLEIPFKKVIATLTQFRGVERRIQFKGIRNNIVFLDDYGHHPTEIKATLSGVRQLYPDRRLVTIFQPHRYSRTKLLVKQFAPVFQQTDLVLLLDIYPAGEKPIRGVSAELIEKVLKPKVKVVFLPKNNKILGRISNYLRSGDVVLTLGAGDVWKIGESLVGNI